jgi:hypothetical protein|tara:strand:- start:177 stop:392 length:216 start_codon:yes stop_codon:yes gene_type:complete
MLKGKDNLNYEYFNRYLINCGSTNPSDMEVLKDFFIEKLNIPPEYELDPEKVILLNEFDIFCRKKQSSLKP